MSHKVGVINGKEAFMQNIASRLGRREPLKEAPINPVRGVPEHYKAIDLNVREKIELFAHNWTALSGQVLVVPKAEAKETIAVYLEKVIGELQVSGVSMWEHAELLELGLEQQLRALNVMTVPWRIMDTKEEASGISNSNVSNRTNWSGRNKLLQFTERCELGIVYPDYVIANTSTLVLQARGGQGRSVSLLPSSLIAIFSADRLVTRMGEALQGIRDTYPTNKDYPSSVNMITGPSRSADIEND
ncbi:MAG: LUD domain-containing protein, partial [Paenibacillaceae bacterium]